MSELNENLRRELLSMRDEDLRVREELAATGELFDGYHPQMEAVHLENARRLEEIVAETGWTGKSLVGEDGAEAAWLIVQHAISLPDFSRRILQILNAEAERGEIPFWQVAYLQDRINVFEGKPQLYGTQFDWDENGEISPFVEIFEPEKLDERRAAAGLSVPYADQVEKQRQAIKNSNELPPKDFAKRQQEFLEWTQKVGWRK